MDGFLYPSPQSEYRTVLSLLKISLVATSFIVTPSEVLFWYVKEERKELGSEDEEGQRFSWGLSVLAENYSEAQSRGNGQKFFFFFKFTVLGRTPRWVTSVTSFNSQEHRNSYYYWQIIKLGTLSLREVRQFAHNHTASRSWSPDYTLPVFSKAHSVLYIIWLCILRKALKEIPACSCGG